MTATSYGAVDHCPIEVQNASIHPIQSYTCAAILLPPPMMSVPEAYRGVTSRERA